jgi:cytochrome c peroxidase
MLSRGRTNSMLFVIMIFAVAGADERGDADDSVLSRFSQTSLLRQFDADDDGRLNGSERNRICRAFGGIDIPMLPPKSYPYTAPAKPRWLTDILRSTDNTPADNPITDAGATLGRVLFYDRQLSDNNSIACASCHHQQWGFSDPERLSLGYKGERTRRNAMSLANLRFTKLRGNHPGFFWDERATTLESQALMPIQDTIEMGMKLPQLEKKLAKLPYYPALFEQAFGTVAVNSDRIARAMGQFIRSMESFNSRFDQAAGSDFSKDFEKFTDDENLGKSLFINGVAGIAEIGCAHCHMPPTFAMPKSFNNGLDLKYSDKGLGERKVDSNDVFTNNNNGKFKASSLRNIELTAPYMHDGRFKTLEQVIEHYSSRVQSHENLGIAFNDESAKASPSSGFRLTPKQKAALIAFLKTLTDESFISDPRFADPFVRVDRSPELLKKNGSP